MNPYFPRILLGFLIAAAFGPYSALAQSEPQIKIVPKGTESEAESQKDPNPTFTPVTPSRSTSGSTTTPKLLVEGDTYKSGDLLTWERAKPMLDRLRRSRTPLPPEKDLKKMFLSENDSLVKMLNTERGKEFFAQLAKKPSSIDLVDRYRSMPRGEQFLQQMINDVGGYEFFTNPMWLTQKDARLASQRGLSNVNNGNKLGEPTGRIYLESQLNSFLAEYRKTGKVRSYE